jgi:hypothetical protein
MDTFPQITIFQPEENRRPRYLEALRELIHR